MIWPSRATFHVHDEFSPLDGAGNRNQLTREAVKNGQTHLGCTNHGRLGSVLDHIHACRHPEVHEDPDDPSHKRSKDERLIPIVGIEAFWRPNRFMDLTDKELYGKNGHNWAQHLCVHAGSLRGWRTLMRLSSKSWVKREDGGGFYGKPCFDWDMLENDSEDIIISTACLSSPLSQLILDGCESDARQWCEDMIDIVGPNNLFLEIMPHNLPAQREVNIGKINIANELGLPYMVTGDVHMPYKSWMTTQSIVRMAAYRTSISKQERKSDAGEDVYTEEIDTIYLSSEEELQEMFDKYHPDLPAGVVQEGLDNTVEFSRRFKGYVIGKTPKLPNVTKNKREAVKIIEQWCDDGFDRIEGQFLERKDYDPIQHERRMQAYQERYEYEFGVLEGKGVLDYFILVGDFVRWAKSDAPLPGDTRKKRPIRVGLGRGSAAGCLISYLIGITAIDPIAWGLLFERFLNPDRVGLPDIDIDFETEIPIMEVNGTSLDGREMVIEYLKRTYGHDHVASIIAYQTFAPRAVIKAVSDTQDIDFLYTKRITDSIGDTDRDLVKIANDNETVAGFRDKYPEVWEHCLRLEDQILRDSRHAGGIVITKKPTNYYMPTQIGSDEKSVVTAWADRAEFPIVSEYGLLKNDILGVKGLAKQELAVQLVKKHYGEIIEPNDLGALRDPYDTEQDVIDAFVQGLTLGVFQFGGRGITNLLRHIKPDNAIDIAVANALYRPGPIKIAFEYGDRKNGTVPVTYWHDSLEPVLRETLGLIAFQEQVMEITKQVGNFTGGQADSMRKAISKLYRLPGDEARDYMQAFFDQWMQGCRENGLKDSDARLIWDMILEFAGYGFNKSHSASYGLQAYQDMHLKEHYPLAFYASLLTIEKKNKREEQVDFLKGVMREAAIYGVDVSPPDVNSSERGWSIDGDKIRYGLVSINGMGGSAAQLVTDNRPYDSFADFITRIPTNFGTDSTYALAKAGAFDSLIDRSYVLSKTRQWPETVARYKVNMSCGCKKTKTVKLDDKTLAAVKEAFVVESKTTTSELMEMATEMIMDDLPCKKHASGEVKDYEEVDPFYPIASWHKEHPTTKPDVIIEPSQNELMDMEQEALNLPLSLRAMLRQYHEFIEERIYTEAEFNDLPAKPARKGKAHGTYCTCEDCNAAHIIIGGEITSVKVITTKKKKEPMAFVDFAFDVNQWSVTLFPYYYRQFAYLLNRPTALLVAGHKDAQGSIIAYDIKDVFDVANAEGYKPDVVRSGDVLDMGGGIRGLVVMDSSGRDTTKPKIKIKKKVAA